MGHTTPEGVLPGGVFSNPKASAPNLSAWLLDCEKTTWTVQRVVPWHTPH
jgi:hypothetical protein